MHYNKELFIIDTLFIIYFFHFSLYSNMEVDKRPKVLVTHWDVPEEVIDLLKSE